MKRTLKAFFLPITLLMVAIMTSCKPTPTPTHDATVRFELSLSESIAKVADLRIVSSCKGNFEVNNSGASYSKVYTGSLSANQTETFLIISAYITLKDNYREVIQDMTTAELNSFYNGCKFSSLLTVEIENDPAVNIQQTDSYKGMPNEGQATVDKVIETLEKHAADPSYSPIFTLNVKKDKSKWSQICSWDVWCERKYYSVE